MRLTGALPRSAVVAELQRAHAFALPVRTRLAGLNPEGLGLAALEAAACGLPVIVRKTCSRIAAGAALRASFASHAE